MNWANENNDEKFATGGKIKKVFPKTFELVLSTEYNEGTYYGNYNNFDPKSGQSTIYVSQPWIEGSLGDVVRHESDSFKWLVGYKGIGKTTLLKNYFRIFKRNAEIHDSKLIIYISFFSGFTANANVEEYISTYVQDASNALQKADPTVKELRNHPNFWDNFYDYIKENNSPLLSKYDDLPDYDETEKRKTLTKFSRSKPDLYRAMLLKYYLRESKEISRVILVFDDLETFDYEEQKKIIQSALHLSACIKTNENRLYKVKTFVSLRSLTIREHLGSFDDAFRNEVRANTIIKREIPKIESVFYKRIEEGKKIEPDKYRDWDDAHQVLKTLLYKLSTTEGEVITKLSNYGIFKSLSAFGVILGNKRYINKNKDHNKGAFKIDIDEYDLRRETIYKALFLQEEDTYIPKGGDLLCNILASYSNQKENCELLGLYIIKYLLHSLPKDNNGFETLDLYGTLDKCETGANIIMNVCSVFEKKESEGYKDLEDRLTWMIKHLYRGSVVCKSIYDTDDYEKIKHLTEKEFFESGRLYLSLRGNTLFNMLSESSILLEILRDDIPSQIYNSHIKSFELAFADRTIYLLEYVRLLFENHEKNFIFSAIKNDRIPRYIEFFGDIFLSSKLLVGIMKSINWYFNDDDPKFEESKEDFNDVKMKFNSTLNIMEDYSKKLKEKRNIQISADPLLKKIN